MCKEVAADWSSFLKEGERLDDLQRKGYQIIQDPSCFCFGIDAVLLSSYAQVGKNESVLDLGCGNGVIPLLLAGKSEGRITGLEIQEESADMAKRSVRLNGLSDRISIVAGDIREADRIFAPASFRVITSNPPYIADGGGIRSVSPQKDIARREICCTLEDVISAAAKLLEPGGRFYLVHRPFRLSDIMVLLRRYRLEPKNLKFVQPFVSEAPNLVLVTAVRGGKPHLTVERPLIVYKEPGVYTDELKEWYYDGKETCDERDALSLRNPDREPGRYVRKSD